MIRIENLQKKYGQTVAVASIDLEIARGETFGLLGPNGAGKTSTIHMLAGLIRPDAGRIVIVGHDEPADHRTRKCFGVAPQELSLYTELSGEENLRFFGSLYGLKRQELATRVSWALEFAGLIDKKNEKVDGYSGGMKRRLNLACALIHAPMILFLDEPAIGVDPASRHFIFECIEKMQQNGTTVLYTTHYMEEAQRLCQRVAIMDKGRILAVDTVAGLIASHGGLSVVEVELDGPPPSSVALPGQLSGNSLRIETDRPLETVARIGELGIKFRRLQVEQADLETVFLNLTGRRLLDL